MTQKAVKRPDPFSIVDGPSLRDLELALTDPVPIIESGSQRTVYFKVINHEGDHRSLQVGLWMMRKEGPVEWECRNPLRWILSLVITPAQYKEVSSIAFQAYRTKHGQQTACELIVNYDPVTRKGHIKIDQED